MKIVKIILLNVLLLIAMCICGTFVMWVLDVILSLEYPSVFVIGTKVGFVAWLILLVGQVYRKCKKSTDK